MIQAECLVSIHIIDCNKMYERNHKHENTLLLLKTFNLIENNMQGILGLVTFLYFQLLNFI